MTEEELEALLDSIGYQGMSPERILRFKEKINASKAKGREALNELFKEPLKNEK